MERNEKGQFTKGSCIHDLSDKVFGRLKVIELAEVKNRRAYWLCQCKCGKQKSIRGDALLSGRTNSCGCLKREMESSNLHITNPHGCKNHPVYHIWANMMSRCYSESNNNYHNYGGRGITVRSEWHDVRNFCKWADETGYVKPLTLERIDVDGNYCPENCKWIPMSEQELNKRNTARIVYNGEIRPLVSVARELGLNVGTVKNRWKKGIRNNDTLLYAGDLRKNLPKEVFGNGRL